MRYRSSFGLMCPQQSLLHYKTYQLIIITSVKKKKLATLVRARGDGSAVVRRGKLDPVPVTQLSKGENRSFARPTSQLWEECPYI